MHCKFKSLLTYLKHTGIAVIVVKVSVETSGKETLSVLVAHKHANFRIRNLEHKLKWKITYTVTGSGPGSTKPMQPNYTGIKLHHQHPAWVFTYD